jgi:hypothetical protein
MILGSYFLLGHPGELSYLFLLSHTRFLRPELVTLPQVDAVEAQWTQRERESMQEREESRKLAALFQKVATFSR